MIKSFRRNLRMKNFIKVVFVILLMTVKLFGQEHRFVIGGYGNIGVYGIQGISLSFNYLFNLNTKFFVSPNYSLTINKERKEIYSFESFTLDFGYFIYKNEDLENYFSLGVSYNNFLRQNYEGNLNLISDREPPNYFSGETKENCLGLIPKLGLLGVINNWLIVGCELKYFFLFPKVKYNYLPSEYSIVKGPETRSILLVGLLIGVRL